jgi:predicted dehydrogenase
MDLGCYGVHALRSLLAAEPEVLAAHSRWRGGVDVATEARLQFPDGIEASLHCVMDPAAPATSVLIEGTDGVLDIGGFVLPQRAGRLCLTRRGVPETLPVDGLSSYAAQLDHVIAVFKGEQQAITGGADAIANMAAIDRIRALAGAPD